jgi:uncharacterized protein
MNRAGWVLGFVLGAVMQTAAGAEALLESLPAGTNLVHDCVGVFSAAQKDDLESFLRGTERATTAEIAVVVVPTIGDADIDVAAGKLFARWGIGKKDRDNGLLLLAAIEDRKIRIEVGYGLEGALPDARTGRILDAHVIPRFKEQKFAEGLMAGAVALAGVVAQESKAEIALPASMQAYAAPATAAGADGETGAGTAAEPPGVGAALAFFGIFGGFIALLIVGKKKGWIKPSSSSGRRGGFSGGRSSGGGGFGGGRSGGGGASRGW